MTSFITQCPHCSTSFRVSSTQLTAARGMVRCGACLEVFNAAHALSQDPQSGQPQQSPLAEAPTQAPAPVAAAPSAGPDRAAQDDSQWIHDDLDLDNLDLDEELAKLEAQERALSRDLNELTEANTLTARPPAQPPHPDEAWAEALLAEEQRDDTKAPPAASPFANDRLTPADRNTAPPPAPLTRPAAPSSAAPLEERIEPALSTTALETQGSDDEQTAIEHSRQEPDLPRGDLFELEEEPLQLDWREQRKPWGRWLGWGLLNLLAAGGLAAQYLVYNFDELARQDRYRPWFELACPSLGCTLPSRVDISQIRSSNLVVRSHPDFEGALVVDAILYNRAPFAQPFPLLELRFADLNGKLVASRSFKPGEYLAGELAGQHEMPPQVPIHIALDILDPGAKAVNYSLSFQSPE
ncbi:DUF3426 domain-containing protein [Pseudomonas sp. AR5]|nr:DUF3426 domain-containing protein [Pseudomonas sp. AR5]